MELTVFMDETIDLVNNVIKWKMELQWQTFLWLRSVVYAFKNADPLKCELEELISLDTLSHLLNGQTSRPEIVANAFSH